MEQMQNTRTSDLLDSQDCLEAIDAMRCMKNSMFFIMMLCLLITGIVFCLERTDHINRTNCLTCGSCPPDSCASAVAVIKEIPAAPAAEDDAAIRKAAETVTAEAQPAGDKEKETVADPNAKTPKPIPAVFRYKPPCQSIEIVLKVCNCILIFAATMFCLTLLIGLKISLAGRLGGISHISRAFFYSLFTLLILIPWQILFPGVLVGAVYTPCELLCQWHADVQDSTFWLVMWYLRFIGFWLVVIWMSFLAMKHSRKWAKASLQRRGLMR